MHFSISSRAHTCLLSGGVLFDARELLFLALLRHVLCVSMPCLVTELRTTKTHYCRTVFPPTITPFPLPRTKRLCLHLSFPATTYAPRHGASVQPTSLVHVLRCRHCQQHARDFSSALSILDSPRSPPRIALITPTTSSLSDDALFLFPYMLIPTQQTLFI